MASAIHANPVMTESFHWNFPNPMASTASSTMKVSSVGLANSLGTAAPSPSSTGSSSVLTPSICTSCSPEIPSSSDLELSPVRRNFTTLKPQELGWILPGVFSSLELCLVSLKALFNQAAARFLLIPRLHSPQGMLGFVFGSGFGYPTLGWDLILVLGYRGCYCAIH